MVACEIDASVNNTGVIVEMSFCFCRAVRAIEAGYFINFLNHFVVPPSRGRERRELVAGHVRPLNGNKLAVHTSYC